jgi:antitoxin HigA-1
VRVGLPAGVIEGRRKMRRNCSPGDVLSDTLTEAGLSANAAALAMAIPANRLTAIINGRRSVTAETAMRLGRFFGTSAKLWMNLQARYDLQVAERSPEKLHG